MSNALAGFMSKFKKIKNVQPNILYAPTEGKIIPLENVKDPVFAEKMMGEGIAVDPASSEIFAPASGQIVTVFPTLHAIGIKTQEGAEIMLHVGLETVDLKGKGFKAFVKKGQQVHAGQKVLEADFAFIKEKGLDPSVIMVITNSKEFDVEILETSQAVYGNELIRLRKKS
jgi:glucose-specific phosphotransferase system IIA component